MVLIVVNIIIALQPCQYLPYQAEENCPEGEVADQEDNNQKTHNTSKSSFLRDVLMNPSPGVLSQDQQRIIKEVRHRGVCCSRISDGHQRETCWFFNLIFVRLDIENHLLTCPGCVSYFLSERSEPEDPGPHQKIYWRTFFCQKCHDRKKNSENCYFDKILTCLSLL